VAIVGGGLTGVEAATEISETYPGLSVALVTTGEIGGGSRRAAGSTCLRPWSASGWAQGADEGRGGEPGSTEDR
jgi:glycine/D-amino acid oxidase-like deaminating enzyme